MQIRRAELSNVEALLPQFMGYLTFYKRNASEAEARKFLTDNLKFERSVIFIALDEGNKVVGFTQLYLRLSSLSMTHYVYISDLFVAPSYRKLGIARKLMKKVEEYSLANNATSMQLETAHTNETAQALYESLHYSQDKDYRTYSLSLPSSALVPTPLAIRPVLANAQSMIR